MSFFSRREMLGSLGAGALGMLALPGQGKSAHVGCDDIRALAGRTSKTRLHRIFCAKPQGYEGWPYHDYDHRARAKVFSAMLDDMPDIEWSGGEIIEDESQLEGLGARLEGSDGLVVIALTSPAVGLRRLYGMNIATPAIVFNDIFRGDCSFLGFQQNAEQAGMRVISLSSEDLGLLERKVQLLRAAARLRRSKILCFSDRDRGSGDFPRTSREVLGVDIGFVGSAELNEACRRSDAAEAGRIADRWIGMASKVVEPTRADIVDSARLYLAIREIMEREKANAATVDCLSFVYGGKIDWYPCLAFVELNDNGYVGACEADLASTLTMLIGGFLADRPGFMSDPVLDTEAGLIYHAHCVAATRMAGLGADREPCNIRTHAEDRSGVSLEVLFTPGRTITAAKYVPFDRMLISTGELIGSKNTELACRSKMVTRVPPEGIRKMINGYGGGLHRVIFYGDLVEDMQDLGRLLGYTTVIETA